MAAIAFTKAELEALMRQNVGAPEEGQADELFAAMEGTGRPMREVSETMDFAAELLGWEDVLGLFAFEGRIVTDPTDAQWLADYVNVGDPYIATILYERENHTFFIQSYGDFIEHWEATHQDERTEEVCGTCGRQLPYDQLEFNEEGTEATCRRCIEERNEIVTWEPREDQPLIAILRAIDGHVIAVHLFSWDSDFGDGDAPPPFLSFSVMQTEDHFIALNPGRWRRQGVEYLPPYRTWASVIDAFTTKQHSDLYVASSDSRDIDVAIEREMFQRLRVAMDAFLEVGAGERQPVKEFRTTPPLLWTCDQVNEIAWITSRPNGRGDREGVQAMVVQREPGSGFEADDIMVWEAGTDELHELIEDGFIKWGDDRTVREYLKHIGVCRAK